MTNQQPQTHVPQESSGVKKQQVARLASELPVAEEQGAIGKEVPKRNRNSTTSSTSKASASKTSAKSSAKSQRTAATRSKTTISTQIKTRSDASDSKLSKADSAASRSVTDRSADRSGVKATWEVPRTTIAARFAQLEHELQQLRSQATQIHDHSASISGEMEELKAIAQDVGDRRIELPIYPSRSKKAIEELNDAIEDTIAQPSTTLRRPSSPIPPLSPAPIADRVEKRSGSIRRTHHSVHSRSRVRQPSHDSVTRWIAKSWKQIVQVLTPNDAEFSLNQTVSQTVNRSIQSTGNATFNRSVNRSANRSNIIAWDALLWVVVGAGLRAIVLKSIVNALPFLAGPITIVTIAPALLALYAALALPKASPVAISRLLLLTLGLFIGGKLP